MPCAVTQDEVAYYSKLFQEQKKEQIKAIKNGSLVVEKDDKIWESPELTESVACYLMQEVENKLSPEEVADFPEWVKGWMENHKAKDARR